MRGRSARITTAGAVVAALVAACVPSTPTAQVPQTVRPQTVREVLTRDLDHPARLDCDNWRYGPLDESGLPGDFDPSNYRYVSSRNPNLAGSRHHLCGQRGPGVDRAWGVSQGREDVLIAVLDSGIEWRDAGAMADLADRAWLNAGELPPPQGSAVHDANGDGHLSIADYEGDPRVGDRNDNGLLDPEDLILSPVFSDGVDDDANGYVDDISGWDVLWNDNNPLDDVDYGHGTGEARDSVARDGGGDSVGTCPTCRFLPVRVGDSFITDGGRFAAGVLFSVDSGADVVQEALGAINNPPQAQAAVDAAYRRGIPVVASMADEASKHPNLPAAMNHTIPVNSITPTLGPLADIAATLGAESDNLSLNGCTNYGGITWVSVPSDSCSSEATGLGAGMVGLIESAARDAGVAPNARLGPRGAGDNVLSANEVAQLLRATADDVDFSSPGTPVVDPPNAPGPDGFTRYPTRPGWDATFGFGRVNTYEAVRAAAAGEIPPEADLVSPSWFEVLGVRGSVAVGGSVAATRSSAYSYRVQWAPGAQPPAHPAVDVWRTVEERTGLTAPVEGVLGSVDLAAVAASLPDGARGASLTDGLPDEDRFAVRVRVVVVDAEGRTGVSQKQVFVHDDPDLATNVHLLGAGAPSPVFADLDDDGADELIVGTDDGRVHAFDAQGDELAGWPVRTPDAAFWTPASPTARADGIPTPGEPVGVGAPVVADLDGDGALEVAVADGGGHVSVWDRRGRLRWRSSVDPRYSPQDETNRRNRLKRGFLASPAAGDLDGDGDLELVAAALDRHVYAWHPDGTPVRGFPVLVVDPARTAAVDPDSHVVTFARPDGVGDGGELIVTPAVADLTGDGRAEIVVGAQEQYDDEPASVFFPLAIPGLSANTRLYAIWNDGTAHSGGDRVAAHPAEQAYLPNWPVPLQMVMGGVLPLIGNGVNAQAAIGNVDGDPAPEIVASSSAGPLYALDVDGRTVRGRELGLQVALDWLGRPYGWRSNSRDGGILAAAFGGPALGDVAGDGGLDAATPTVGLVQALDQLLPGRQPGDTQLMAWNAGTGEALPGFPHRTRDLGFFVTPAIADVDADGAQEVVAAHGVSLVDAVNAQGVDAPGWPKLSGGWAVGTPGFGDREGDGRAEVAITRRDGKLMVWRLPTRSDSIGDWTRFGGGGTNSGSVPATVGGAIRGRGTR